MATRPAQPVTPPPVRSNGNPPKLKPKKRRPADSPEPELSRPHIEGPGPCEAMQALLRALYRHLAALPPAMTKTGSPAKDPFENMTFGVGAADVIKFANNAFNHDLHVLVSDKLYNYMTTEAAELTANADECAPDEKAVLPKATRMSGATYEGYVRLHLSDVGPSVAPEIRRAVLGGLFAGSSFSRAPKEVQSVGWIDDDDEYSAIVTNVGDGSVQVTLDVDGESYEIFLGSKCHILMVVLHHDAEECSLFRTEQ
jgi:hypothetical protein